MNFTDTGTLITWQLDDINVIEPLHGKEDGGSRGGVYLCIPNFEELTPPFSIKHGEYRTTVCDTALPHQKNLFSSNEQNWGNIDVTTDWEDIEEQNCKTLKVTTTIRALSDRSWVRPGFHPYFSVSPNSFIQIGTTQVDVATLPHDCLQKYPAATLSDEVKITTAHYTATVTCNISPASEKLALVFGIWSDKKHDYVCIEPVIGRQPDADGLPQPISLQKDEEMVLAFTIRADRSGIS